MATHVLATRSHPQAGESLQEALHGGSSPEGGVGRAEQHGACRDNPQRHAMRLRAPGLRDGTVQAQPDHAPTAAPPLLSIPEGVPRIGNPCGNRVHFLTTDRIVRRDLSAPICGLCPLPRSLDVAA
eukprot:3566439-Prymnesium_polylepis.1